MDDKILIDWEENGLLLTMHGVIDGADVESMVATYHADERSVYIRYIILDATRATIGQMTPRELDYAVAVDIGASKTSPRIKVALVGTDPQVVTACLYYIEKSRALGTTWDIRVFASMTEARVWSGD